jgi:hypothetical protein
LAHQPGQRKRRRSWFRKLVKAYGDLFAAAVQTYEAQSARPTPTNAKLRALEALSWLAQAETAPKLEDARIMVRAFFKSGLSIRAFCAGLNPPIWPNTFQYWRRKYFQAVADRLNRKGVPKTARLTKPPTFGPGIAVGIDAIAEEFGCTVKKVQRMLDDLAMPVTTYTGSVIALRRREPKKSDRFDRLPPELRSNGLWGMVATHPPEPASGFHISYGIYGVEPTIEAAETRKKTLLGSQIVEHVGEKLYILLEAARRERLDRCDRFAATKCEIASPGELVVHAIYGVGRYAGLRTTNVAGAPDDYLEIHYADGKLLLPEKRVGLLTPCGSETTKLDQLGGRVVERPRLRRASASSTPTRRTSARGDTQAQTQMAA